MNSHTVSVAPSTYWVRLELLSDTTFGRGDGVAGLLDDEVQHDEHGLPFLGGKTLKGLLCAECAEILFALTHMTANDSSRWQQAAHYLFGRPGSAASDGGCMAVGDARLPADLRAAVAAQFAAVDLKFTQAKHAEAERSRLRAANLDSLTTIRRQTALDAVSGAPKRNTLRSMRVILRTTLFDAPLAFAAAPPADARMLLAACCAALRRAGTGRNRGRGRLQADLYGCSPLTENAKPVTLAWLQEFEEAVHLWTR